MKTLPLPLTASQNAALWWLANRAEPPIFDGRRAFGNGAHAKTWQSLIAKGFVRVLGDRIIATRIDPPLELTEMDFEETVLKAREIAKGFQPWQP